VIRIGKRSSRRGSDRIVINLASMIDVSFLLLFYFMVSTMLEDRETRLSTGLQSRTESAEGSVGDLQTQYVDVKVIDSAPAYVVGSRTCRNRADLQSVLRPLPKSAGLFVRVFDGVDVGYAVAAIQVARDSGFDLVTYVPAK
jgi:biopolymer transport protein ExbD